MHIIYSQNIQKLLKINMFSSISLKFESQRNFQSTSLLQLFIRTLERDICKVTIYLQFIILISSPPWFMFLQT